MRNLSYCLFLIPLTTLCLSHSVQARLNTITGGVTMGYDYDKTQYDRDTVEDSLLDRDTVQEQLSIGPLFIFETTSSTDGMTISLNPSYVYEMEESESDVDYDFSLTAYRDFTRRLRIELGEDFIFSDDPELLNAETSSDYNRGRRQYWTNDFNINSTYMYDTESSIGLGYTYRVLRNDDTGPGGYEDYDRHIADLSVEHRINNKWNFLLFTNYTRGLFDPPEPALVDRTETILEDITPGISDNVNTEDLSNDLSEYQMGGTINWVLSSRKTFWVSYDFTMSEYDAALRNDSNLHNLALGTQYQYTRLLSFDIGAGPSYEKTETFDSNLDYNAHFNLNFDIAEHSSIEGGVEKGYDQENFSENNTLLGRDQGLTDFWDYHLNITHNFTRDLTATFSGTYRDEKQENILYGFVNATEADTALAAADRETFRDVNTFKRKIYEAGGSLDYTFLEWYTASVGYTYRNQDSEIINDSYNEHRFLLTFSFEKELFRW